MLDRKAKPTSTVASKATPIESVSGHERRIADIAIDQTITASAAQARFSMDAQRRRIASRIIIEAVSSGTIEMMCRTIVTEVNARPISPKPASENSKLVKSIEHCKDGLFSVQDTIPPTPFVPTIRTECVQVNWTRSLFAVVDPKIYGTITRQDGRIYVRLGDRTIYYDVRFREDQLLELVADHKAGRLTYSPLPDTPNPATRYDYEKLIPDLIASAKNGMLEKEFGSFAKFGVKAKLENALLDAIDGISEPTARRKANQLIAMNEKAKIGIATQE